MSSVVIIGGGVGGLTAAHELVDRGYAVTLIEKTGIPGGKARSKPVVPEGPTPWSDLPRFQRASPDERVPWVPGEHGFRFFPGFYKHVIDSMNRIPHPTGGTAADRLVPVSRCGYSQYGKPTFSLPAHFPRTPADLTTVLAGLLTALSPVAGLTHDDLAHFGSRIWQIMTSCEARRLEEYEHISWWDFVDAEKRSDAFRKFLAIGFTRTMVAARAESASTRTIGNTFVQLLLDVLDPLIATTDQVLDGPTNQTWIYPWLVHVRKQGVTYLSESEVTELRFSRGRVNGVVVRSADTERYIEADYFVCAVPVERAAQLFTPAIIEADQRLEGIADLAANSLEWMNGVQYYLRRPLHMVRGHMIHFDSEWALTSISQLDFWKPGTMKRYGSGEIQGILSVDVSDWSAPAPCGLSAAQHSRDGVCKEVWRQLKRSLNSVGEEVLRDDDLIGYYLDSCVHEHENSLGRLWIDEPLLVNETGSWDKRPEAGTAIPNLFLAADYVRTYTDLATMEGANEAARRAVNCILKLEGRSDEECTVWPLHEPAILAPLRQYDAASYALGLPWNASLSKLASDSLRTAGPLLSPVADLITQVQPAVLETQRTLDDLEGSLPLREIEKAVQPIIKHVQAATEKMEASLPTREMEAAIIDGLRKGSQSNSRSADRRSGMDPCVGDPGPAPFDERLEWYRSQAIETVLGAIPESEPQEHLYELVREFVTRPGKGLRPSLCIATCRAFGGEDSAAVPLAAGIELLHNAFLVHDDIEDESDFRRGAPTLHRMVGIPMALNVGDAMNALSMRLFRRGAAALGEQASRRIFDEVDHMALATMEGQAMELGWIRRNDCGVNADDYMRMVLRKTAWYSFIHPLRLGALASRSAAADVDRFNRFGFLMGAAFQIQDDVLNLMGDPERYGKEIDGDLWEGKRTLPLIHALQNASGSERSRLESYLGNSRQSRLTRQVFELRRVLEQHGSIQWAREVAAAFVGAAEATFEEAFAGARSGPDLDFIGTLVQHVVRRSA